MDTMPNYLEYDDLFEYYSAEDLDTAWEALHNHELEAELNDRGSYLLRFFVDTNLQEQLRLYQADMESFDNRGQ